MQISAAGTSKPTIISFSDSPMISRTSQQSKNRLSRWVNIMFRKLNFPFDKKSLEKEDEDFA